MKELWWQKRSATGAKGIDAGESEGTIQKAIFSWEMVRRRGMGVRRRCGNHGCATKINRKLAWGVRGEGAMQDDIREESKRGELSPATCSASLGMPRVDPGQPRKRQKKRKARSERKNRGHSASRVASRKERVRWKDM